MDFGQPRHRPTSHVTNMSSSTRRLPPIPSYDSKIHSSLPPAPDAPSWTPPALPIRQSQPNNGSSSLPREPYHVISSVPRPLHNAEPSPGNRRSPSPGPVAPGAPRIPLLSNSDVEDEDKELAGMDRGYLRLGGCRPYLPSPPPTPEPPQRETRPEDEADQTLPKMNEQLDFAMQYIQAQAQMAARSPGPRVVRQSAENSAGNDHLQLQLPPQNDAFTLSRPLHHERRHRLATSHHHQLDRHAGHRQEQHTVSRPKQLHPRLHFRIVVGQGRETRYLLN